MRYYGKEGLHCTPQCAHATTTSGKVRLMGRAVLFGRVPPVVVRWLGVGVMVASLVVGMICLTGPTPGERLLKQLPSNDTLLIRHR